MKSPTVVPQIPAGTSPEPRPRKSSSNDRAANLAFWGFMAPSLIGLMLFTIVPIFWGFALSLSQAQNTIKPGHFVGLANYQDLLTDEAFLHSLWTIVVFAAFIVPFTYA